MAAWLPKGESRIKRNKVRAAIVSLLVSLVLTNSVYTACAYAQPAIADLKPVVSEGVCLDASDAGHGLIRLSYASSNQKKIKLLILKDENRYTYNLEADGSIESFPLQMGNGWYSVCVLENIEGKKYRYIFSKMINVQITNQNDVYLNSIQNINWNYGMDAIKKASGIFKGLTTQEQKIKAAYEFVIKNIK